MRLPSFIKAIVGCTDTESSRYSLGGVKCESADNVSIITVTDGRKLLNVSYGDECDPVDCIIEAKPLVKACAAAHAKGRNTVFEIVEGASGHKQIGVKPELLIDLLAVFKAAGVEGVRVYVGDAENALYFAGTAPTGEVLRAVLMPMSLDVTPFPGEFASDAEEIAEPATV